MCCENLAPPSWRPVAGSGSSQTGSPLRPASLQRSRYLLDVMPAAGGVLFMQRLFAVCVLIAGGVLFLTGTLTKSINGDRSLPLGTQQPLGHSSGCRCLPPPSPTCPVAPASPLCPTGVIYSPKPSDMPGLMARHVPRIIVVGSGLAGTAAALAAAEAAGPHTQVVVLEKEARPGGCWPGAEQMSVVGCSSNKLFKRSVSSDKKLLAPLAPGCLSPHAPPSLTPHPSAGQAATA